MGLWQPSPAGCFLTLHLRWPASCRPCKGQRTRKGGRAVEAPEAPGAVESRGRKRKLGAPRREHVQPFQPHRPRWGWSCAVPALRLHLLPGQERVRACQRSGTGRRWVAVLPHCSPLPQPACWGLLRVLSQRRITVRGTAGAGPAVFSRSFCFLAPRVSLSACSVRFASLLCARLSHVAHLGYGGGLLGALQGSPHHPTPFAQSEPSVKKPAEILISLSAYTRPTLSKGHSHHN